jgi:glycosyltransferase involved in cell wall biosynthesis
MPNKSKKKILYVITKSAWGGAGKYVYDLATNLPKDKFEIYVAAGGEEELASKIKEAGVFYYNIINFQRDINVLKEIFAYFEIIFLLLKIRPDIIHVNSSKAGGIVGIAAWDYRFLTFNFGLKIIFTAHGWAFHEIRPKWQIFIIKLLSKITAFYYSKIICVSEFDRLSAVKNHIASAKKLITIHNGIKIENYHFLSKEEACENLKSQISNLKNKIEAKKEIWIGTIGEFTKNKGQKYLIDAIKLLVTRYPLLVAIIIGWGEEKSNLKSQISNLKLENNIFLINNLPDAASYLKAFDIFVLPSIKEGLPYTLLEAGLAELPVIATKVGGIHEIVGHDEGFLVDAGNSNELAGKIEELIENSEKRKFMGINLWHKILREFSLEKMLTSTLSAYE